MKMLNGILGGGSGKIGGAVAFSWKGIPVLRSYAIPSNPQTAAQTAQRDRMSACVIKAKSLLSTVITNYWNSFAVKMSGYNSWVKQNIMNLAATTFYYTTDNVMSQGSLEGTAITGAVLAANEVTFTWDETIYGNGALTDTADLIVVNKETNAVYMNTDTLTRDDETGVVDCGAEADESKLIAFLIFKRGTGSTYMVCDSTSLQCTA
jgi:hypothetical protein